MSLLLPAPTGEWQFIPYPHSKLDEMAARIERRWGVGRLPILVSTETRTRFSQAEDMHRAAQEADQDMAPLDAMMMRAWAALEAEAEARSAEPMPAGVWEIEADEPLRGVIVVAHDDQHAQVLRLRDKKEGRTTEVWTKAEVARVLQAHTVLGVAKTVFPGAEVRRRAPMPVMDEIPFGGPVDEATGQ